MEGFLSPISRAERPCNSNPSNMSDQLSISKTLLSKHFGSHIFRAAAIGGSELIGSKALFTESEVGYFQIAIHIDHNVLWFDIAVDDILTVQILYSLQYLNEAISGIVFCHFTNSTKVVEQLSTCTI